jgi:hypothetical protein
MPANQRLGFDDDQGLFPIAEARPEDEGETGGVVQSPRLDLPLLIEGQLLSEEQDFRAQGGARAEQETEEKKPSVTRSVIELRRESSEPFALGKNRDMGCQDGTRSVRLRSIFCSQDWFLEFASAEKPNK